MKPIALAAALFLPLTQLAVAPLVAAPQAAAAPSQTAPTRTYTPADFTQYAPQSALDMLQKVPGFSIRQEDSDRGLGQASGNVLVNGQRISGKSNDVITELSRIAAKNVERIEIVDGATLNIPGLTGQVANVIVKSTGISGQYGYYPEFRQYFTDPRFTRFDISANGTKGPIEYTLALDNKSNRSGAGGPTYIYSPQHDLTELRDEEWKANSERPRISGKFAYDGPGTSVGNLNVSFAHPIFDYLETGTRNSSAQPDRHRKVTIGEEGNSYEIGGDYELALGAGRLKLIGVDTYSSVPSVTEVVTVSPVSKSGDRFAGTGDENERIGRAEYRWKSNGAEWQLSGEGAFNTLDNTSRLFSMNTDGTFVEVPLPGATARVTEDRYEVMGSWGKSVRPNLTLKFEGGGEYSKLSAGGEHEARTFYRPKGEVSTAWKVSPKLDVNVKLARRVGQLNFYDFLASVDLTDNTHNAGNSDLVPQQSWEVDAEGVRNLGAVGTTTLHLYGRLIDDIIDYIPIGETGESPGNLDQAKIYGIESRTTFNLDRFGWKGARTDVSMQVEHSEVEDPLTHEMRPISNNLMRAASISLRHDIPRTNVAWGADASYERYAKNYRLTEVGYLFEGPYWGSLYLEHKNIRGLTVRGGIYNLFRADSRWDRTVFEGRRTDPVAFYERRNRVIGPIFSFSIRGKF